MEIDKNDVNLSDLFKWKDEVVITDAEGEEAAKVYMRILGDAEQNRARAEALRESGKLRKILQNPESDERLIYTEEVEPFDKEKVVTSIILLTIGELYDQARDKVDIPFPKEPGSEASQEEQENYQEEVDEYPDKYTEAVEEEFEKLRKAELKRLKKLDEEALRGLYMEGMINRVCNNKLQDVYLDYCVYHGTFLDEDLKKKAFSNFSEYENSAKLVKDQLKNAYQKLSLTSERLKK